MKTIIRSDITDALKSVGLQSGDSVMVHTSLGKIGYVCGGAQTVIEPLIEVVGQQTEIQRAFLGQLCTHSMHKIHSVPFSRFLELSVTSTFIGHTRLHLPQDIHFSLSHFIRISEK